MFGSPTIMITTPDACKQVLMDDEHFVTGWPKATLELIGKKSFIGISHEEHKRLRRLTSTPINGYEALNTYLHFIDESVVSTLEKWAVMGEFEFLTELRRLTFRIIMKIFLNKESDVITESLERVYTDLNYGVRAMAINFPGFAYQKALKVSILFLPPFRLSLLFIYRFFFHRLGKGWWKFSKQFLTKEELRAERVRIRQRKIWWTI